MKYTIKSRYITPATTRPTHHCDRLLSYFDPSISQTLNTSRPTTTTTTTIDWLLYNVNLIGAVVISHLEHIALKRKTLNTNSKQPNVSHIIVGSLSSTIGHGDGRLEN